MLVDVHGIEYVCIVEVQVVFSFYCRCFSGLNATVLAYGQVNYLCVYVHIVHVHVHCTFAQVHFMVIKGSRQKCMYMYACMLYLHMLFC